MGFQRMKEEAEDVLMLVSAKLPGRSIIWTTFGVFLLVIFVVAFGAGFGAGESSACKWGDCAVPVYYFVNQHNESCPALVGERLLTTVREGQSFDGLTVRLQCRGNYVAFPSAVRCQRKKEFDGRSVLEWSHLPVCVPLTLLSPQYWRETLHARSVVCTGDTAATTCSLTCLNDFVPVEEEKYRCQSLPCQAWRISGKKCYRCDQSCQQFGDLRTPAVSDLLGSLSCDRGCHQVVVTSEAGAAVWQNKRTGLFTFIGEHNSRPLYLKNSTQEYLYYVNGSEWMIGPDFRKVHAGIQIFNNDDSQCPERHGGTNHTKVYIDSSKPLLGNANIWMEDKTIKVECYSEIFTKVSKCDCEEYQVDYNHSDGELDAVNYYTGNFKKLPRRESRDLLAPAYYDAVKGLYLYSHHPQGLVWIISTDWVTSPVRSLIQQTPSCPDSPGMVWEVYNFTAQSGQQLYVEEKSFKINCKW